MANKGHARVSVQGEVAFDPLTNKDSNFVGISVDIGGRTIPVTIFKTNEDGNKAATKIVKGSKVRLSGFWAARKAYNTEKKEVGLKDENGKDVWESYLAVDKSEREKDSVEILDDD